MGILKVDFEVVVNAENCVRVFRNNVVFKDMLRKWDIVVCGLPSRWRERGLVRGTRVSLRTDEASSSTMHLSVLSSKLLGSVLW